MTTTEIAPVNAAEAPAPARQPRLDIAETAPNIYRAQAGLEAAVRRSGIDPVLYELIKIRASQLNGCAFCLDMHTQDARLAGESEQRIYLLSAWREAPFYTDRERAALALTEAVTLISANHVPDEVWNAAAAVFTPEELAAIVMGIVVINGWNRISIATETHAGSYVAGGTAK